MAAAQPITGTVDGGARSWHVLEHDGASSARFEEQGRFIFATITGLPDPADPAQLEGALEISIMLQGQPGALSVVDADMIYMAGGAGGLYLPDPDGAELELTLTESRAEGAGLFLSGHITARVHRVISLAAEELDLDDSHRIEAGFALTLAPG